jgi:hypothetical protein
MGYHNPRTWTASARKIHKLQWMIAAVNQLWSPGISKQSYEE